MFSGLSPSREITGAVVSTTFTTLVAVFAEFPDESVTLYVRVYVPRFDESTEPVMITLEDKSPSVESVAENPGST